MYNIFLTTTLKHLDAKLWMMRCRINVGINGGSLTKNNKKEKSRKKADEKLPKFVAKSKKIIYFFKLENPIVTIQYQSPIMQLFGVGLLQVVL